MSRDACGLGNWRMIRINGQKVIVCGLRAQREQRKAHERARKRAIELAEREELLRPRNDR
jgi:hypothetical protein